MNTKTRPLSKSARLYQRGCKVMPGGVSRNTVLRSPHPIYAVKGEGCYVTDVEGVKRIDFANNMAALIHGHAHPEVVAAVKKQVENGTAFSLATEAEVLCAEHLCRRNSGFEKLRFVNSGTEAVMSCLKAARAYTGRSKIAKVEGAYHGNYDYAEVSQTADPDNWGDINSPSRVPVAQGTPRSALDDVIIIPFNNSKLAVEILDRHADELACILIDPMPHRVGLLPAEADFIQTLYRWSRKNGALFVCDEVITLRSRYGGAQEWYDIHPDLTALGKMIGGGFPVGAIAGRRDVMEVMNPLIEKIVFPLSGTFSANPVTMTAGRISLELFDRAAVKKLNNMADRARSQINEAIRVAGLPACVTGSGSMFRVHMKLEVPKNYRETYVSVAEQVRLKVLLDYLFEKGLILINTCSGALSTAMTENEIDRLSEIMLGGFRKVKEELDL